MPVIEPCSEAPARSRRRGSMAKADGGYARDAGGSPADSPTSLCAVIVRVMLSKNNRTFDPPSRKCSAIRVAVNVACSRTIGGMSDVATTTMDLARPSSPRSFSINSRTSRPRSPTSPTTTTSAEVFLAIMDMSVDLPTPDPAKIPTRCPLPIGTKVSIALMPR